MPIRLSSDGLTYHEPSDTLTKYLRTLRKISEVWHTGQRPSNRLWFRGHGDTRWALTPSVYRETYDELPAAPVALQPPHKSQRLTAQKGTFTLHGSDRRSIHDHIGLREHLVKIELRADKLSQMKRDLAAAGVTETTVFPELPALCRELLEHWSE